MMLQKLNLRLALAAFFATVAAVSAADPLPQLPVPYLTPAEAVPKFIFAEPGYSLEPVLTEPDIAEPVACAFDGNGRLYVAEMRSYMLDRDGRNASAPISRVSVHWSTKGDGRFDKHAVFADKLHLPRMILPLADGVLINETDSNDIYLYRDLNGDAVADKKELWYAGGARSGSIASQPAGLVWCMDNWIYTTQNPYRLRWTPTNVLKEMTVTNDGHWGLSQDDNGKPWFINADGERGPIHFQQPIIYGLFQVRDEMEPSFAEVWPFVGLGDAQGGATRLRSADKTLNHFTAACGGEIFRGNALPATLRGDLFFAEPVGRLIRRAKVDVRSGITYLRNAYAKAEFIRSTDPNFRPLQLTTAPDGTLFIVDMYRGVIEEANRMKPGSYLRNVVKQHSLEKNMGRGRIWRLVHKDIPTGPWPKMLSQSPVQLVVNLEHTNGWWRDNAQKLLVLRRDRSVVPTLVSMARNSADPLARIHSLWTLEGLDMLTPELAAEKLNDAHPQVRLAAIRASESLIKRGNIPLRAGIEARAADKNVSVVIQAMLTANLLKFPERTNFIRSVMATNTARGVQEIGKQIFNGPDPAAYPKLTQAQWETLVRGEGIYKESCHTCHGPDGRGQRSTAGGSSLGPPLAGSKTVLGHRAAIVDVLLHGLTGPLDNKTYSKRMAAMGTNTDEWISDVASYVRNAFGSRASFISREDVARERKATLDRAEPWTIESLRASLPRPLTNTAQWKVSASHNPESLPFAVDGNPETRYDTREFQSAGMFVQIELPMVTPISGVILDAGKNWRHAPGAYKIELSRDGWAWSEPVAFGKGEGRLEVNFLPAAARFVRVTETTAAIGVPWGIAEIKLLTREATASQAAAKTRQVAP